MRGVEMPDTISEEIKRRVHEHGWIPRALLGEGGGAKVYLCVRRSLVDSFRETIKIAGQSVGHPDRDQNQLCKTIEEVDHHLLAKRDGVAALKIPKTADPSEFERIRREVAAMRSVEHAALVKVLDVDDKEPPEWFAMELQRGGNLSSIVARFRGRVIETLSAIRPIVEAMARVHEKGFVHRDIKPSNIFVSVEGNLVLGDLGIVFPRDLQGERLTEIGETLISRDWVPDWARFTDAEPQKKWDVFMLAKVIYFMVTGGRNVMASQLDSPQVCLSARLGEIEGVTEMQEFLEECITTSEEDGLFENAGDLLNRLDELLNQLRGTVQESLLFSFISTHSSTHVIIRPGYEDVPRYASLTRLQMYLPNRTKRLRARMRISGPPSPSRFLLFLQTGNRHLLPSGGYPFEVTPTDDGRGVWIPEIVVTLETPLSRGWHDLDINVISDATCVVTGFMLWGG